MHIGVLTGGGDVPGLNSCIKAIVEQAAERGWSVTGFRRGWAGPLHYNPADPATHDNFLPLDPATVRIIDRSGGTFLHTSRTNPGAVRPAELPPFLNGGGRIAERAWPGRCDGTRDEGPRCARYRCAGADRW
jgi:hypothetical protein